MIFVPALTAYVWLKPSSLLTVIDALLTASMTPCWVSRVSNPPSPFLTTLSPCSGMARFFFFWACPAAGEFPGGGAAEVVGLVERGHGLCGAGPDRSHPGPAEGDDDSARQYNTSPSGALWNRHRFALPPVPGLSPKPWAPA